jgi:hypothetical protein
MYRAKPHQPEPYDHKRRVQRGAEYDLVHKLREHPAVRSATNRAWLATKPDRLRLMGEK